MLQGILHVNLTIAPGPQALAEARHFYVDLLGLQELERPVDIDGGTPGLWLSCGSGQQIHLSAEEHPETYNAPSKRHAAFEVADLEVLRQRLAEAQVSLSYSNEVPGVRRLFARDKWGNRLEFVQVL